MEVKVCGLFKNDLKGPGGMRFLTSNSSRRSMLMCHGSFDSGRRNKIDWKINNNLRKPVKRNNAVINNKSNNSSGSLKSTMGTTTRKINESCRFFPEVPSPSGRLERAPSVLSEASTLPLFDCRSPKESSRKRIDWKLGPRKEPMVARTFGDGTVRTRGKESLPTMRVTPIIEHPENPEELMYDLAVKHWVQKQFRSFSRRKAEESDS